MSAQRDAVTTLAVTLRSARQARGFSISQLAALAHVSPRLVGELERGMRAHVSFETAMRLLQIVDVSVAFDRRAPDTHADAARRARADVRRRTWSGEKTTLTRQAAPQPSSSPAARLTAVARASLLAAGLQTAYRKASGRRSTKTSR
jgi:transcriptional regulator with XRE-family HTH domain